MTILSSRERNFAFRLLALVLVVTAGLTFVPLWAPLVLAAWVAVMARPLSNKLAKAAGGGQRAAGALVALLVVVFLVPLILALISLSRGAIGLWQSVAASEGAKTALTTMVSGSSSTDSWDELLSPTKMLDLLKEHGAQATHVVTGIAGVAASATIGIFIFIYAVYVFLIDGPAQYAWIERHAPVDVEHTRRLAAAFNETGRGLFVGVGLTSLAQGAVATITYLALGVPRALVLGLVTCIASLVPSVGTAIVWIPIAIGLALTGKVVSAVILGAVGVFIIGTVDNVLRPVFARFGQLNLSTFVLLTSIFGGLAMFGIWGLFLGPLFVRLAKEVLVILQDERARAGAPSEEVEESTTP